MRVPIALLLFAISALPAPAATWGSRGISRSFVVRGSLLYAADGRGVSVYDVSDAARPRRADLETGDDETRDLAFMGASDLVVATRAGVDRFAVGADGLLSRLESLALSGGAGVIAASPSHAAAAAGREVAVLERKDGRLRQRTRLRMSADVAALAFVEGLLYVSLVREGTFVFAPPSSEAVAALPTSPTSFALSGDRLWAASASQGLVEIDVRDPAAPRIVRKTPVSGSPTSLAADGDIVVTVEPPDRVDVYDVSSTPLALATLSEPVRAIAISGGQLFLSGALLDAERMPVENGKPVRVFDLSSPGAPRLLGEIVEAAGPVSGVWTDGSLAYVVDPPFLRVVDVSRTEEPRQITAIAVPDIQDRIRVRNRLAVLWGRATVNLVDVSSPLRPRHVGNWQTQGHPPGGATIAADKVIEANMHSGLHVVSFADPAAPAQVGGRIWHYSDVAAQDDVIYALQDFGFLILRLEEGRTIVDVDRRTADAKQLELSRGGRYLLAAAGTEGVRLFDLADRFNPVEIAFIPLEQSGPAGVSEDAAWIESEGELFRLDLRAPAVLQPTGLRVTAASQISAAKGKVVVADRYQLRVYGPDTPPPPALPPSKRRSARH